MTTKQHTWITRTLNVSLDINKFTAEEASQLIADVTANWPKPPAGFTGMMFDRQPFVNSIKAKYSL